MTSPGVLPGNFQDFCGVLGRFCNRFEYICSKNCRKTIILMKKFIFSGLGRPTEKTDAPNYYRTPPRSTGEQGFPRHRFLICDFECFFEGDLIGGVGAKSII